MRAGNFVLGSILLAMGAVSFALMSQGGAPAADASISLSEISFVEDVPTYGANPDRIRFAIAAVLSPRSALESYEPLAEYLGRRLGRPVELVLGNSYAETNALVRSGDAALALVCSGAFVTGRRDFGMQELAVPMVDGAMTYHSYLIVPSDSPASTWEDLRDKTFAFTDPLSNSGRLVPVYVLSQMGENPDSFFRSHIFTYSHDRSVQAVADGVVDGAAVDSLVYNSMVREDSSVGTRTRVGWVSPPYGINPMVVNPDIDAGLRDQMLAILLGMREHDEGLRVLENLGIDMFMAPRDPTAYDSIEAMVDATTPR